MDQLVNSMDLPLFLINGCGTVLRANRSAMERYGFKQGDLGTTTIWEHIPFTLAAEWKKEIAKVIRKRATRSFQFDQGDRIKELSVWPAFDDNQRLNGFALMEKDITENIRALELHRKFQDKNECTDQQMHHASTLINLGTLVAGMAHEISNPNAFITTNAPLLERLWGDLAETIDDRLQNPDLVAGGLTASEIKEIVPKLLQGITDGARRIDTIVKSLRSFSRPDPHAAFVPVCLNSVIQTALIFLTNEIQKSTHHFYTHLDKSPAPIAGIPQRLEQVVINLVLNACQALTHEDQQITLETQTRRSAKSGKTDVIFKVIDQGCGIDPQTLERIYDPFFTTKAAIKGTGLGLTITQKIVKEHHGWIEFHSEPGTGTSVVVGFPAMEGD
ncbi:signal transduction histidine kinase (PAS/PAC domain protein) [Desulforapulum autotrophicum HRM2]|uniref:histidine kinase n=1 Tax=Desulforapulum autotrophicum (strain ATCC 43914 / DSM 3382 / VKM B-1955 / HRM2) TaxID=177437 RepID=C0QCI3_DESAH|nr:ATP-binding protein [Desulforapulum autotrophicum]ACN15060.1 signal transduction histidine kinase (PAS/PAC domain protein) [Desulforapulum autotrophicum HRM2]